VPLAAALVRRIIAYDLIAERSVEAKCLRFFGSFKSSRLCGMA
jgi:hypothetical protein